MAAVYISVAVIGAALVIVMATICVQSAAMGESPASSGKSYQSSNDQRFHFQSQLFKTPDFGPLNLKPSNTTKASENPPTTPRHENSAPDPTGLMQSV